MIRAVRVMTVTETELADVCIDVAKGLVGSGAEIYRVREHIRKILAAYSYPNAQVVLNPVECTVTLRDRAGRPVTVTGELHPGTDLDKLGKYIDAAKFIADKHPGYDVCMRRLSSVGVRRRYPKRVMFVSSFIVAACGVLILGGTFPEAVFAGLLSLIVQLLRMKLEGSEASFFLMSFCCSAAVSAAAVIVSAIGFVEHYDLLIVGGCMSVVPVIPFVDMMRELVTGDTRSAALKLAHLIFSLCGIFLGAGIAVAVSIKL